MTSAYSNALAPAAPKPAAAVEARNPRPRAGPGREVNLPSVPAFFYLLWVERQEPEQNFWVPRLAGT
ncbi:hypothetical protein GCM10027346_42560 [Hymenobacter seoulensis]